MARIGDLHDNSVNHGQVQRSRHAVVQEAGVHHLAVVAEVILFVQRPADALHRASLDLPFHVAGMHCLAGILNRRIAQDFGFPGFRVNLNVHQVHTERIALAGRVQARGSGDASAGGVELPRQVLEGEAQLLRLMADHAAFVLNIFRRHVPNGRRPFDQLLLDVLCRKDSRPTGGEGGAAAAGDHGVSDGVRVNHLGLDVLIRYAKGLGSLLRD